MGNDETGTVPQKRQRLACNHLLGYLQRRSRRWQHNRRNGFSRMWPRSQVTANVCSGGPLASWGRALEADSISRDLQFKAGNLRNRSTGDGDPLCYRTGHHAFDAELHRARGKILLKGDPANSAPAEEAFRTAIAVAKRQGTRSFELRAALSLAKLYRESSRPADARAVLAPALEGFSPTPEMPEIGEALELMAAIDANVRSCRGVAASQGAQDS
jgi:hypothetical protein